ncbi:hypothetical protein [Methanolobus psychrotolerans]|uniref:hypothetical protein n=1 Tax=Methanolobus psychrotolerans TaxID=1874706 RepID=UPI001F5D28A0|nr:hypothetical protein [Methanolobus psychrotolerans]
MMVPLYERPDRIPRTIPVKRQASYPDALLPGNMIIRIPAIETNMEKMPRFVLFSFRKKGDSNATYTGAV